MPLIITKHHLSVLEHSFEQLNKDSPYATDHQSDFSDDEGDMSDSSILNRGRPRKAIRMPIVPIKDQLRASRILENLTIQLNHLQKNAKYKSDHSEDIEEDPHETYLSSEEDASESADESIEAYDESYVELDADLRPSTASTYGRGSFEVTARAISFIFAGKPHLVSILSPASPIMDRESAPSKAPSRTSSLRPRAAKLQSYPASPYPSPSARRPSTASLPAFLDANLTTTSADLETSSHRSTTRSSTARLALANLVTTRVPRQASLPPRTSSVPRFTTSDIATTEAVAFLASEAPEIEIASPTSPNTPHSAITPNPLSATTRTPTDRFKAGVGRIMAARRLPSMPALSAAFMHNAAKNDKSGAHDTAVVDEDDSASLSSYRRRHDDDFDASSMRSSSYWPDSNEVLARRGMDSEERASGSAPAALAPRRSIARVSTTPLSVQTSSSTITTAVPSLPTLPPRRATTTDSTQRNSHPPPPPPPRIPSSRRSSTQRNSTAAEPQALAGVKHSKSMRLKKGLGAAMRMVRTDPSAGSSLGLPPSFMR